jgi:3-isopropylmalate/(R)-2-methylmalate dehydratase small subunit
MFNENIRGRVWKFEDNISTDLMLPAFLIDKGASMTLLERAKYCMFSNRPGWASQVKPGDIIIARHNFGCGSSRPAAAQLQNLGISVVVAESIARIFFRNAINLGFPCLICPGVFSLFSEEDMAEVDINSGRVTNLSTGKWLQGDRLDEDSPPLQILRAGGILQLLEKEYMPK